MNDPHVNIDPPLYLVRRQEYCWRCNAEMPVVVLLAPNVQGMRVEACVLSNITDLPQAVLRYVQRRFPTFKPTSVKRYTARRVIDRIDGKRANSIGSSCQLIKISK